MKIIEIFEKLKSTPGTNAKKNIINENHTDTLEMIFKDTYDSSRKYYIHKYNKDLPVGSYTLDNDYMHFHDILDKLANREYTGMKAILLLEDVISKYDAESQEVLHKILGRNLKLGTSIVSFSKATYTDNFKDKFKVALANNLDKLKGVDPIDGTWFASRKLDGVRCIAIVDTENRTVKFMSRQGKEFTSLENLVKPMLILGDSYEAKHIVFDGELCAIDENGNEDFSKAIQKVTKKNIQATDVKYCIFDILPYDVFVSGKDTSNNPMNYFGNRYNTYTELYNKNKENEDVAKYISVLFQERITSQEQFDNWSKMVKDNGWEGFMLRKDLPYEAGRIKDLIKVKKFQDAEYVVKDIKTGKVVYNEGGMKEYDVVTGIVIEHKGKDVTVGSGLSKEQRIEWFKDPSNIIGKTVTVQYFSESKNLANNLLSLRFPVLKHVYENGRDC